MLVDLDWLREERMPDPAAVEVRPSQRERLTRRAQLRQSAKEQAHQVGKEIGSRGRGRKGQERGRKTN